ncbi:MAG: anacyclamide/piricyclamide family prenylated cyclic peptide, partial [Dolichospermum sp.]
MTKKNIRPQQVAPVERETISTAKDQSGQVTAQFGPEGNPPEMTP